MRLIERLAGLLLPRTCAACGGDVPSSGSDAVCDPCWEGFPRWTGLSCAACGLPLRDGGARCGDCRRRRRAFRFIRSAGVYEGGLLRVIKKFKYGGRTDLARPLGRMLADLWRGEPRLGPVDAVAPVPLHWLRERTRGYNQALLLAEDFGRRTGLPVLKVLSRRRGGASQTALRREERVENVRDVFAAARPELVRGKTWLLVDDVCTTGATLEACARALKAAGARRVGGVSVARQVAF